MSAVTLKAGAGRIGLHILCGPLPDIARVALETAKELARVLMPRAPFSLSSNAMQASGGTSSRVAASRYRAGSGLP